MKKLIYVVIDGVDIRAYEKESKARKAYTAIIKKRWHECENGFDDYHRAIGKALIEHYTCINGRTMMMRAVTMETEKEGNGWED